MRLAGQAGRERKFLPHARPFRAFFHLVGQLDAAGKALAIFGAGQLHLHLQRSRGLRTGQIHPGLHGHALEGVHAGLVQGQVEGEAVFPLGAHEGGVLPGMRMVAGERIAVDAPAAQGLKVVHGHVVAHPAAPLARGAGGQQRGPGAHGQSPGQQPGLSR